MRLLLFGLLVARLTFCDDWIDLGDMLNYDHAGKKMVPEENQTEPVMDRLNKLHFCERADTAYFRQFVKQLSRHFSFPLGPFDTVHYEMMLTLSKDSLNKLESFSSQDPGISIQDAHSILSVMIDSVKQINDDRKLSWLEEISPWATIAFQIAVFIWVAIFLLYYVSRIQLSWKQMMFRVSIAAFLMSIPWTWWHLVLEETAKRHTMAAKDIPKKCMKNDFTWGETIWSFLTVRSDECWEYHRGLVVDPVWDVPPTKAVAVTFTKFLVEPAEHIGLALRNFFMVVLKDIPWTFYPFMLLFTSLLIILVLLVFSGYRIKLFHLIGLEPGNNQQEIEHLRQQIDHLRMELLLKTLVQVAMNATPHTHRSLQQFQITTPALLSQSRAKIS